MKKKIINHQISKYSYEVSIQQKLNAKNNLILVVCQPSHGGNLFVEKEIIVAGSKKQDYSFDCCN